MESSRKFNFNAAFLELSRTLALSLFAREPVPTLQHATGLLPYHRQRACTTSPWTKPGKY
ncbi:hypothetical protein HOLleu_29378 [Holothuria leucospilota]|uniref:Uncharacterized protein n=1 Tax=Holothuria leucospilota TaxID=206669 RepID=A0A9Q1H2L2_HOLLE|nr:hypothetical protein HOLleu_29378 [Holothuria leucospilota]